MDRLVLSDAAPLICLAQVNDREAWRLTSSTATINVSGTAAVVGAAKRAERITSAT